MNWDISIFASRQVVTEYERAVIFRLGRLKKGGSLGPGLHFELPCIEHVEVVDMRTSKMKVPPQEVRLCQLIAPFLVMCAQNRYSINCPTETI